MSQKIKTNSRFGLNLRELRKKNKLTQEQVVAKLQILGFDMSRSIYAQIECGTYNIRITELAALKDIFSTTYDSFFEGIEISDKL